MLGLLSNRKQSLMVVNSKRKPLSDVSLSVNECCKVTLTLNTCIWFIKFSGIVDTEGIKKMDAESVYP